MRLAITAPTLAPTICAMTYTEASRVEMPPRIRSASVTTGLKCAPDRTKEQGSGPGHRQPPWRWSSRAVPTRRRPVTGVGRRSRSRRRWRRGARCRRLRRWPGERGRGPLSTPLPKIPVPSAAWCVPGVLGVYEVVRPPSRRRQHRVDLPRLAVGRVDPHLVLHGEATRHLIRGRRGEVPWSAQTIAECHDHLFSLVCPQLPRWLSVPPSGPSMRTSFKAVRSTARSSRTRAVNFAGSVPQERSRTRLPRQGSSTFSAGVVCTRAWQRLHEVYLRDSSIRSSMRECIDHSSICTIGRQPM